MSNRVTIQPTKFEDVRTGEISYGIRVYDDYSQSYINTWDSIPDDDGELLSKITTENNNEIDAMLQFAADNGNGVMIGNEFYDNYFINKYY